MSSVCISIRLLARHERHSRSGALQKSETNRHSSGEDVLECSIAVVFQEPLRREIGDHSHLRAESMPRDSTCISDGLSLSL